MRLLGLIVMLLMADIAQAKTIEVFALSKHTIVISDATARAHNIVYYWLDASAILAEKLSTSAPLPQNIPKDKNQQALLAKNLEKRLFGQLQRKIQSIDKKVLLRLQRSYSGQILATQFNIKRFPAIMVDRDKIYYSNNVDHIVKNRIQNGGLTQ